MDTTGIPKPHFSVSTKCRFHLGFSLDCSGVPASVIFNAGETSKTFDFTPTDDMEDDDGESVKLSFGTMPDPRITAGTTAETTVSITDNDHPEVTVSFGLSQYTVAEGGTVTLTVELNADPERTVIIPITATGQNNATPADYSIPNSITFNTGETSKTFEFSATDDTEDDDDENVRLAFGPSLQHRVTPGSIDETTISIIDNDHPEVTVYFGADTYTVPEGGTATITLTLSADPERTVAIPLTATPQNGAIPTDYSVPEEITFTSGQTSQTFTFTATEDTEDDDDETVLLAFGASLPDRVNPGTLIQTIVRITDNDDPEVTASFSEPAYTVPEGESQLITVTLSADPERTVTIPLTVMNQDGASSDDYSSLPVNLTFNERDTSKSFTFTATDDFIDDDGESVLLAFGELPERVSAGTTATVNINDDDGAGNLGPPSHRCPSTRAVPAPTPSGWTASPPLV